MQPNPLRLTRELIDIPSTTGDEQAVAAYLHARLDELGFEVERQEVSAAANDRPPRHNLLAAFPNRKARVVLSTHIDCVPPHIASSEDADYIYGRGACDTKGIIAAQLCAGAELRDEGAADFGFLFTVDEEMDSCGAKLANEHRRAADCKYLINGEPTDNRLATFSKGSLRLRLHAAGRAAHSAYPEHGDSAILKLLDALDNLRRARFPVHELYGDTTLNIGTIEGGTRPNVIPEAAHADLQIRLVSDAEEVERIVRRSVAGFAEVEILSLAAPVRLMSIAGFETCTVRFTTDVSHLGKWGTPLLIGCGSILDAHTPDEKISKRQLTDAVTLYKNLTWNLLRRADA